MKTRTSAIEYFSKYCHMLNELRRYICGNDHVHRAAYRWVFLQEKNTLFFSYSQRKAEFKPELTQSFFKAPYLMLEGAYLWLFFDIYLVFWAHWCIKYLVHGRRCKEYAEHQIAIRLNKFNKHNFAKSALRNIHQINYFETMCQLFSNKIDVMATYFIWISSSIKIRGPDL